MDLLNIQPVQPSQPMTQPQAGILPTAALMTAAAIQTVQAAPPAGKSRKDFDRQRREQDTDSRQNAAEAKLRGGLSDIII